MAVLSGHDPEVVWNLGKHEQGVMPLPACGTDQSSIFQKKVKIRVRYEVVERRHALFSSQMRHGFFLRSSAQFSDR
ncbi:hypothetical protein NBRC3255_1631 [Gluconobacter thailandicus NBRC 3255]|nr:hypothetical protein NBRC3255_1631 [Gluconobacter thailandicus NBRC 3255]